MEEKRYEVEMVYREKVRYQVSAPDRETAERIAMELWQEGEDGVEEESALELVQVIEPPDEESCGRDCEEAIRFLRDRELVIERLDQDAFNPTVHDAVSAEEVARHLGWARGDRELDVQRAARALDRLCAQHRVVCFTRPRVRRGERGDIRLYCTPEYLERLTTAALGEVERQAV